EAYGTAIAISPTLGRGRRLGPRARASRWLALIAIPDGGSMKYLGLAYGDVDAWKGLPKEQQAALLSQDEQLRKRGDLVAAVAPASTRVRAWDGTPQTTEGAAGASF